MVSARSTPASTASGLHHVTAVAGDVARNASFYAGLLGLRLVKRTVNFDDPSAYHLYFGDGEGSPGSLLTFFYWAGAHGTASGRVGAGASCALSFSIPSGARDFWRDRLAAAGVSARASQRLGEAVLNFADPDGIPVELVEAEGDRRIPWSQSGVPATSAIRGLHTAPLLVRHLAATEAVLEHGLGLTRVRSETGQSRWAAGEAVAGHYVDVIAADASTPNAVGGVGTIHHVALRAADDATQAGLHRRLAAASIMASPVRDRQYFRSIYFREPSGVLGEIATDAPGFAIDETVEQLGKALRLPPQFEPHRALITESLPPLPANL
jgi:glyoxalase family protein